MIKKCERCKKDFDAKENFHKLCPNCFRTPKRTTDIQPDLLLAAYYDKDGNPLKQLYIDIPENLALIFANDNPPLGTKQLRDFLQIILKARNKMLLKGIEAARPILYKCQAETEYQLKRGIIPNSFIQFMKHHIAMAEKNDKALEGFYQHLDAIVCYFPKEK